jgi:hypothetical protein
LPLRRSCRRCPVALLPSIRHLPFLLKVGCCILPPPSSIPTTSPS